MIIDESKLHLKKTKSPMATVEVDVDGLEAQGENFPDTIHNALVDFLEESDQENPCFSVYTFFTQSVNFHEPTNSFFVGVVGNKTFLQSLLHFLLSIKGVRARFSDHIDPWKARLEYHVENDSVWQPYEPGSWWCKNEDSAEQLDDEIGSVNIAGGKLTPSLASPTRYRAARNDASIRTIKTTIEEIFGLPAGSVALVKPDGSKIKSNATIATLRKSWD